MVAEEMSRYYLFFLLFLFTEVHAGSLGLGEKKFAILIANYSWQAPSSSTIPNPPIWAHTEFTPEMAFARADRLNQYVSENSFGKVWLSSLYDTTADHKADVYGPYTVQVTPNCNYSGVQKSIRAAFRAEHPELEIEAYDIVMYVTGLGPCVGLPTGWLSGSGQGQALTPIDHLPSMAHELGHTFGVGHAGNLVHCDFARQGVDGCGPRDAADPYSPAGERYFEPYGDQFDVMGCCAGHFNAPNKERAGYFTAENVRLQDPSYRSVYSLDPIEKATQDLQVVKIPYDDEQSYYYVSYRSKGAYLPVLSTRTPNPSDRITVHYAFRESFEPSTVEVAILKAGERYVDYLKGLTFEAGRASNGTMTVKISSEQTRDDSFLRGDSNSDGKVNMSDAISILDYLFQGHSMDCQKAADVNDDGKVNIADVDALVSYLYKGGPPPGAPFFKDSRSPCGSDPTPDALRCQKGPRSCF